VFTARYGLIPYIKQITFSLSKAAGDMDDLPTQQYARAISGFRCGVNKTWALLRCCVALRTFRDNLSGPIFKVQAGQEVTDRLVGQSIGSHFQGSSSLTLEDGTL